MEPTTLGYEKKTNPYLKLGKVEFVEKVMGEELVVPRYFQKMEEYNLNGPPLLAELAILRRFRWRLRRKSYVQSAGYGTRMPNSFAGSQSPTRLAFGLAEPAFTQAGYWTPNNTLFLCLNAKLMLTR